MTHTLEQARRLVVRLHARVVVVDHLKGEQRWHVVLPSGAPRTLKVRP
jgi:hypothetical protein